MGAVFRLLRRLYYRVLPVSWLMNERMALFDYKADLLEQRPSAQRDEEIGHITECIDDTAVELSRRGYWK